MTLIGGSPPLAAARGLRYPPYGHRVSPGQPVTPGTPDFSHAEDAKIAKKANPKGFFAFFASLARDLLSGVRI